MGDTKEGVCMTAEQRHRGNRCTDIYAYYINTVVNM